MEKHQLLINILGLYTELPIECPHNNDSYYEGLDKPFSRPDIMFDSRRTMTPAYVRALKQTAKHPTPKQRGNPHLIVVHIRRGDVTFSVQKHRYRYLPNSHYINLIARYQHNNSRVIILSESESDESFDVFRGAGYEVWLDTSVIEAWSLILTSQVFIMSRSSFSRVPAIFCDGIVAYTKFWSPPLPEWHVYDHTDPRATPLYLQPNGRLGKTQYFNDNI
jgi:hypothetical protein